MYIVGCVVKLCVGVFCLAEPMAGVTPKAVVVEFPLGTAPVHPEMGPAGVSKEEALNARMMSSLPLLREFTYRAFESSSYTARKENLPTYVCNEGWVMGFK